MLAQRVSPTASLGSTGVLRAAGVARPLAPTRRQPAVQPQALFGGLFGGKKEAAAGGAAAQQFYICADCGFIYDQGEFKKAPGSYRCPVCNSPKSRFKVYKGAVKGKPSNTGAALKQRMQKREW